MKPVVVLSKTHSMKKLLRSLSLNTVCEESKCPNISECFSNGTATFMILGDRCTRGCTFCSVKRGNLREPNAEEPYLLLEAVKRLKLNYVVITSPTRDDLPDGGAKHFAECTRLLKENLPGIKVELLIPDLRGSEDALMQVVDSKPDLINHNIETVPRLYPYVRVGAKYERSLWVLKKVKEFAPNIPTKSALILGFGETKEEIIKVMEDLRSVECDILVIGQYYQPSLKHYPVKRYYTLEEFEELEDIAYRMGFRKVVSRPNARSSYKAWEVLV